MSGLMNLVSLGEKERSFTSDVLKNYAKLRYLQLEASRESEVLVKQLSRDDVMRVEEMLRSMVQVEAQVEVPEYLSVRDVSRLTSLSPQMVRRHCIDKTYKAYQIAGVNSSWRIDPEQFKTNPNWSRFLFERDEEFSRSERVATIAEQLWAADVEVVAKGEEQGEND